MDVDIRTDVDRLIAVLSGAPEKMFTIDELSQATSMGERSVKKWAHILESKGKVRIVYKLTKEHVVWAGEDDAAGTEDAHQNADRHTHQFRKTVDIATGTGVSDATAGQKKGEAHVSGAMQNGMEDAADFQAAKQAEEEFRRKMKYRQLLEEKKLIIERLGRADEEKRRNSEAAEKIAAMQLEKMQKKAEEVGRLVEEKAEIEGKMIPLSQEAQKSLDKIGDSLLGHEKRLLRLREEASRAHSKAAAGRIRMQEKKEARTVMACLRELRGTSEKYGQRLHWMKARDEEISARIAKAKMELAALVGEGLRLSQMQEDELERAYGKLPKAGGAGKESRGANYGALAAAKRKMAKAQVRKRKNDSGSKRRMLREYIRNRIARKRRGKSD